MAEGKRSIGSPSGAAIGGRVNSIGLKKQELGELLDVLDRNESPGPVRRRDFARWPFRNVSVSIEVLHPGSTMAVTLLMACRNLSCSGMSLLHSNYMHTGTECTVTLVHPRIGPTKIAGVVKRCSHIRGNVHEIGVRFSAPIAARDFVARDPFADCFSNETVDPASLQGCLVVAGESEMDHKLITHFVRVTQLRVRRAITADDAAAIVGEGCDLVLLDSNLPGRAGVDPIEEVRLSAGNTPVILMTQDASQATRARLQGAKVNAFLAKPIHQDILLRALAEFVTPRSLSGSAVSSLTRDDPNYALVSGFVDHLRLCARKLTDALAREDAAACRAVCVDLTGSAPSVGFRHIASLAGHAGQALASGQTAAESSATVRAVIGACERARAA